jgi:hypothetical protein
MPKRLLLITPVFYGVENKIKSVLEDNGYEVIWLENISPKFDYHGTKSKFKFLRKIYSILFFPQMRYIDKELDKIDDLKFDLLFSINGFIICNYLFRKLRKINPRLYSILYLWDSFNMYNWAKELKYFDKVLTFDPDDAKKYRIEYKPIFYVSGPANSHQELGYDLFCAGKFNSLRLEIVDKLLSSLEDSEIRYYVKLWPAYKTYFHCRLIYKLLKITKLKGQWIKNYLLNFEVIEGKLKKDYIEKSSVSFEEIQEHILNSNVILNLPFQSQKGYSFGLIEALANGKKVITTNSNIVGESFFNPNQIHILNPDNPDIDYKWVKEKSVFPSDNYFANLELSLWLKSLLNVHLA